MTILLARHGAHDEVGRVLSGRSEIALNAAGLAEARALAGRLARTPPAAILASPRLRCRQTAGPVAAVLGLSVQAAPALDEIDFGAFAGRSFAALDRDPAWRRWNAERSTARCPGGETMAEAVARAAACLHAAAAPGPPLLCVTHCDIIRGLAAHALGLDLQALLALPCDPGSLTAMEAEGGRLRLVTLNERPGQAGALQ